MDLVFEEDSGFLHTVQHFINTTKIPIIMTTSDPGFECQINAKFEALVFKAPSVVTLKSCFDIYLFFNHTPRSRPKRHRFCQCICKLCPVYLVTWKKKKKISFRGIMIKSVQTDRLKLDFITVYQAVFCFICTRLLGSIWYCWNKMYLLLD